MSHTHNKKKLMNKCEICVWVEKQNKVYLDDEDDDDGNSYGMNISYK